MASELKLPGKFAAGQKYWLDGKTLNDWRDALVKDRIIPGDGLKENQGKLGRVLDVEEGANGTCSGPTIILGASGGSPAIVLLPGQLTSGTYNVNVNTGGPWTVAGTATEYIWLEVSGDAIETDGILSGGFNGSSYTVSKGASLPAPTIPDHGSTPGTAIIELGIVEAVAGVMTIKNRRCGHINLTFCPGQGFGW